jgi:hypothetical protein
LWPIIPVMSVRFDRVSDILSVKKGDKIRKSDRFGLFTGKKVGNTPQKGINWLGDYPDLFHVMVKCTLNSGYSDRWIDSNQEVFLYYLMIEKKGTEHAVINYNSKENKALLSQKEHSAPILLFTEISGEMLNVEGRFEVVSLCHDNPVHTGIDSVLLRRIME